MLKQWVSVNANASLQQDASEAFYTRLRHRVLGIRRSLFIELDLVGCRDFDRRPALAEPVLNAWGAQSPAVVDRVVDFLPQKAKSAEVEEQRRVAAEIKRELAAKKAAKAAAAAAALLASAPAQEEDLFWDYGQPAAVSAPPAEAAKPAQVRIITLRRRLHILLLPHGSINICEPVCGSLKFF